MKVFMLSFMSSSGTITRQKIQDFLDEQREVLNWFGAMPNTIIIISNEDVFDLSQPLREHFGADFTFILSEIEPTKTDGFINKKVWDFINSPKASGRW
ncbi:hypothetical protein [Citrobacter sp. R56]|uniref:hypothetical protein n=1 Tax=Citrobacter sp. R56 TaxID=1573676 RepID=UPI00193AFF6D|nr:hypothetical protein [Citrobacter sp. R56]QRG80194.1 hypothetical protein JM656_05630 [Citrobacter sp. R56]